MKNPYISNLCLSSLGKTYLTLLGRKLRASDCERYKKSSSASSDRTSSWLGSIKMPLVCLVVLIAGTSIAAAGSRALPQSHNTGMAISAPVQSKLTRKKVYKKAGHQLEAIAQFSVEARVLSAARYSSGREAKISPVDLALGWSKMASGSLLSQVAVTQSDRFASVRYNPAAEINVKDIVHNSSNMHMIPSSREVSKTLHTIKKGQVVQIEGYLVNIRHNDGWRWLTSTSRTDQGDGACEIILITSIKVVG